MEFSRITVVTGHYGSGKTNFSVNIALDLAKQGKQVTVVDLDIVNPYFRTADFAELFEQNGVTLNVPRFANSNLDIPALNFDIGSIVNQGGYVVLDVGGDETGAIALARYSGILQNIKDLQMWYVVNCYRYLTKEPSEALELMYEIEAASLLKASGIVNNSNLGTETVTEDIRKSLPYAKKIAEQAGLPLICTAGKRELITDEIDNPYPVNIYVKTLWN